MVIIVLQAVVIVELELIQIVPNPHPNYYHFEEVLD